MNGLEFKKYREKLLLSQEMMGKSLFVSKRTIINYEKSEKVREDKVQLMHFIYSKREVKKEGKDFESLKIDNKLNIIYKMLEDFLIRTKRNEETINQTGRNLLDYMIILQEFIGDIDTQLHYIKKSK